MIFSAFTLSQYILCVLITFFLLLLDTVIVNINSRLYSEYFKIELLPWNRLIYKKLSGFVALFVSLFCNIFIFVVLLILPVKISFTVFYLGFISYKVLNSILRLVEYWRIGRHENK